MTPKYKNIIGFAIVFSFCINSVLALADEATWNTAMQAAGPLHWYKFDEPPGDPNCYDHGSGGLDGIYRELVDQAQEGAFGPDTAVRFEFGGQDDLMWTKGGALAVPEWTAQFIVKKMHSAESIGQALCDSNTYSIRLVGWYTNEELSFTLYDVADYRFDPIPGKSLVVPLGVWSNITFRKNALGTQVFIDGEMVGNTLENIDLPIETFGGRRDIDWDTMNGFMDEAVIFDRALSDFELAKHSFAYKQPLIPDTFELYEDNSSLSSLWTTDNATVELTTEQTYEGSRSMKVVFGPGGGSSVKDVPITYDYTQKGGATLEFWFKGDTANTEGTVTFTLNDPNGQIVASTTAPAPSNSDSWNLAEIFVDVDRGDIDPNTKWDQVDTLKIDVSAQGTVYFDKIDFIAPEVPLKKVLQWDFDQTEGRIVSDSVNGVNGVLDYTEPAVWIEDGGHTGQIGDHALYMGPDPNYYVAAYNVTAPEDVDALFDSEMDFSINMWVKFFDDPVGFVPLGGFGCGQEPTTSHSTRYIVYSQDRGVTWWPHNNDIFSDQMVSLNDWHMLTITYNAWYRFGRVYIDGKEVARGEIPDGLVDAQHEITISPLGPVPSSYFEGLIDDFSVWQGVLPPEDTDDDPTNDILSLWGSWICPDIDKPAFDFDDDCRIGIGDIAMFAESWLFCGKRPLDFCLY